jgi:hypothetical protein
MFMVHMDTQVQRHLCDGGVRPAVYRAGHPYGVRRHLGSALAGWRDQAHDALGVYLQAAAPEGSSAWVCALPCPIAAVQQPLQGRLMSTKKQRRVAFFNTAGTKVQQCPRKEASNKHASGLMGASYRVGGEQTHLTGQWLGSLQAQI